MEIETSSVVSEKHIEEAKKYGIQSSDLTDTKKYIIAFLNRLLIHREKIDKNVFIAHLNPTVANLWQEVGRSQNTVPIASTQVAIKGIVQHSTTVNYS